MYETKILSINLKLQTKPGFSDSEAFSLSRIPESAANNDKGLVVQTP